MRRFKDNKNFNKFNLCSCIRKEGELCTQPNLAYTTGDMFDLWKRGIPIDNQNVTSNFFDGDKNPSWDVPIERCRGIDIADIWQAQQDARHKVRTVSKKAFVAQSEANLNNK